MTELTLAPEKRIRELDGWRGISLLLVVLHHCFLFAFPAVLLRWVHVQHLFYFAGELGVRIFFAISGFVITRLLVLEERREGAVSLKAFYTRRFFRILPVFYLMVAAVCVLSWMKLTPVSGQAVLRAALFVRDVKAGGFDWFLGHAWTLAVEEQFYIVFPLLWVATLPRRRHVVLFATLGWFTVWGILAHWGVLAHALTESAIVGFSCINVGALLAVFEPQARNLAAKVPPFVPLLIAAYLFIRPAADNPISSTVYLAAAPFGVGLVVMYTVSRQGWASSTLKTGALQWVGLVSYSAYLWQELFTGSAIFYGSAAAARGFHLALPALLPLAAASFYWIERPSTRFGRRMSGRSKAAQVEILELQR